MMRHLSGPLSGASSPPLKAAMSPTRVLVLPAGREPVPSGGTRRPPIRASAWAIASATLAGATAARGEGCRRLSLAAMSSWARGTRPLPAGGAHSAVTTPLISRAALAGTRGPPTKRQAALRKGACRVFVKTAAQ